MPAYKDFEDVAFTKVGHLPASPIRRLEAAASGVSSARDRVADLVTQLVGPAPTAHGSMDKSSDAAGGGLLGSVHDLSGGIRRDVDAILADLGRLANHIEPGGPR